MQNLRLPFGAGWSFINLIANSHHDSVYLITCAICFNHFPCPPKSFGKTQICAKRYRKNNCHCINDNDDEVRTQLWIF